MLSEHAQQRMRERKVSLDDIYNCLSTGEVENKIDLPWRVKITNNKGLVIIVDKVRYIVVTVYWV